MYGKCPQGSISEPEMRNKEKEQPPGELAGVRVGKPAAEQGTPRFTLARE